MLKGFKEFITKGNVVDLAVAVILGTAFTAVINSVVGGIVRPLISAFGGSDVRGLGFQLVSSKPATFVAISPIITAIIDFLAVSAILYFALIVPMKRMMGNRYKAMEPDNALLAEIRDLLRDGSPAMAAPGDTAMAESAAIVEDERRWFDNAARQGRHYVDEQYRP